MLVHLPCELCGIKGEYFNNETVGVMLTKEASKMYLYTDEVYTLANFPEIDCREVIHSCPDRTYRYRIQAEAERTGDWSKLEYYLRSGGKILNIGDYRAFLYLRLNVKCTAYVMEAVELLGKREDIELASECGYMYADPGPAPDIDPVLLEELRMMGK